MHLSDLPLVTHAVTAPGQATKRLLVVVCVMLVVTLDGVMYIVAVVDPPD